MHHDKSIDDRHPDVQRGLCAGRGSRRNVIVAFAAATLAFASLALSGCATSPTTDLSSSQTAAPVGGLRIGTYDSRAVALAFVRSDAYAAYMKDVKQNHDQAQERGDAQRAAALDAYGESQQVRRHLQGFSTAPVDDILNTVRDKLPDVAQRMNVAVITREADHHDASVEVIDVTDELVALFKPGAKTLEVIADLREQRPVPIEVVARKPTGDAQP